MDSTTNNSQIQVLEVKKMKRSNGEGTWGKKKINGYDYFFFRKSYPFLDKPKYFYGKTKKDVQQSVKDFESNTQIHVVDAKRTVGEYLEHYLKTVKYEEVNAGKITQRGYDGMEMIVRTQVKNLKEYDLYNKQFADLNEHILQSYVNGLVKHGYARKTIQKITGLISQCLKYGANQNPPDLSRNYMKLVALPSEDKVEKKKKEITFLSKTQLALLADECKKVNSVKRNVYGNNGYVLILIGYTGIRFGEAVALRWSDINKNNTATIRTAGTKHVARDKNGEPIYNIDENGKKTVKHVKETKSPKTAAGIRTIPLPPQALMALEYFKQFKKSDDDLVVKNIKGKTINQDNLRRSLHAICRNAGLPEISPHELRHSYGSIILHEEHVDIQVVSKLLGHKSVSTTYNIYAHVLGEIMANAVKVFEQ